MTSEITLAESRDLVRLENVIKTGVETFMEVGAALAEIRDRRLYRIEYKTFEAYCREKWGMSRVQAHHLISGAKAVETLTIVNKTAITTESQARELAKVEPARREEVVEAAVAATSGNLTAAAIKEAAEVVSPLYPPTSEEGWSPEAEAAGDEAERDSAKLWALKAAWRKASKKDRSAFLQWISNNP